MLLTISQRWRVLQAERKVLAVNSAVYREVRTYEKELENISNEVECQDGLKGAITSGCAPRGR